MKREIIPSLFATDRGTFLQKLEKLKFSKNLHIDFMDGNFTSRKSVSFKTFEKILDYPKIDFEIHLMAYNPLKYLKNIVNLKIKKVLIHVEVFERNSELISTVEEYKRKGVEVSLVLNPSTSMKRILPFTQIIDGVMFMTVWPGSEGQEFIYDVLDNIISLKKYYKDIPVEIDGGVNGKDIKEAMIAGVDLFAVGSYVSGEKFPKKHYMELKDIVNKK